MSAQHQPGPLRRALRLSPRAESEAIALTGIRRLLVGYDGSVPAREALRAAATLLRTGGACTVLSVAPYPLVGGPREDSVQPSASRAESGQPATHPWSDEAAQILRRLGAAATLGATTGDPGTALARAARNAATDLLVLGHHGREARRPPALGEVTRRLIASPPCSILVAGSQPVTAFQRVLVAFASSPPEDTTMHAAVSLARHCGATLLLLQVLAEETAEPAGRRLRTSPAGATDSALALGWAVQMCQRLGVEPHVDVVRGGFATALIAHAIHLSVDIVCPGIAPEPAHVDAVYHTVGAAVLVPPLPPPPAG
ncbi:MAG TPA: universal stress protein [Chloroflexota bacterium]|nr:universal stress protein [Chloroflexota bacterium]